MRKFLKAIRPAVAADGSKVFVLWTSPFDFLEFSSRSEAKAFVKRHWRELEDTAEEWDW